MYLIVVIGFSSSEAQALQRSFEYQHVSDTLNGIAPTARLTPQS
jgi:hypothetical protein